MKIINESPDKNVDVMENLLFCNISAKKLWRESKPSELLYLYGIISKQYGYNINKKIDKICADIVLTKCALFN